MPTDSDNQYVSANPNSSSGQLDDSLSTLAQQYARQAPDSLRDGLRKVIRDMTDSGVAECCLREGMRPLDFSLSDAHGNRHSLYAQLNTGPVVLSFLQSADQEYAGIGLERLRRAAPAVAERFGASILVLMPELPEANCDGLTVLADTGNLTASFFGLVLSIPEMLRPLYDSHGIEPPTLADPSAFDLTLAATYVLDSQGQIRLAITEAEPHREGLREVLVCLQQLQT